MKKFIKAFFEGTALEIYGTVVMLGLVFAIWLLIKEVPTLAGWSAAGTVIGAFTIIIGVIVINTFCGWALNENAEDAEFASWIFISDKDYYIKAYKEWINSKEEK